MVGRNTGHIFCVYVLKTLLSRMYNYILKFCHITFLSYAGSGSSLLLQENRNNMETYCKIFFHFANVIIVQSIIIKEFSSYLCNAPFLISVLNFINSFNI